MKEFLNLRKDRDVGMALSDTFSFIGQNIKPLGKILLYLVAPFYLIGSLISSWSQYQMSNQINAIDPEDFFEVNAALDWFSLGGSFLFQILASAVMTSCVFLFIRLYEKNFHNEANGLEKAKEITVGDISSKVWSHIPWVFGYSIIWFCMIFIASMFFLIPGIFLAVATSLLFAVYFLEEKGFSESMSRSMDLIRNNLLRSFGFWILLLIIFWVFNFIISFPFTLVTEGSMLFGITEYTTTTMIAQTIITFLSSLLNIVFTVGAAIWYYSLSEKKEAISLENKIGRIGGEYDEDMFR